MREILFRGKDKWKMCRNWVYGGVVHQTDYFGEKCDKWFIIDGTDTQDYDIGPEYEIIPETLGEYAALCDKNGTKIFEGDIVHAFIEGMIDFIGIVKYEEECAYFCMDDIQDENRFTEFCHYNSSQLEVIGNIYDNPELITHP